MPPPPADYKEEPLRPDSITSTANLRPGQHAMKVTGKSSSFVKGNFNGTCTFSATNQPILDSKGSIRGRIGGELNFLYTQGAIRSLRLYFGEFPIKEMSYPIMNYNEFRQILPKDSIGGIYSLAARYEFLSREGTLTILKVEDQYIDGKFDAYFLSEQGDSIHIETNFKAVRE